MQPFTLPASITAETIGTLLGDLQHAPLTDGALAIDAAPVETITLPGVRLLLALGKALAMAGGTFTILDPSAAFTEAFRALGLDGQLIQWSHSNEH